MQTICIIDAGAGQKKMPLLFTPFTVTRFAMHRNHALHDFCLLYTSVNRFTIRERLGTKEIREWAFRELEKAEEEQVSDNAGTDLIHRIRILYIRHVLKNTDDKGMEPQAEIALLSLIHI